MPEEYTFNGAKLPEFRVFLYSDYVRYYFYQQNVDGLSTGNFRNYVLKQYNPN